MHDLDIKFQGTNSAAETWRGLLEYAVLAPSARNSQPWIWEVDGDALKLYADRERERPVADPTGRELVASCGAALMHLRIAMRHFGTHGEVETLPDERDPHLLARVTLGGRHSPSAQDETLFHAIAARHTNRGTFEQKNIPETALATLRHEADCEGAWLHVVQDEADRGALTDLIARGDEILWHDREFRDEFADWTRTGGTNQKDGIAGRTLGMKRHGVPLAPLAMRVMNLGSDEAGRDWLLAGAAPALVVLGTESDTPRQWLRAGEALARVLLRACTLGLSASFFNQPIEVAELRPQLRLIIGRCGFPQLIFRLGYAQQLAPSTARRPAEAILASTPA